MAEITKSIAAIDAVKLNKELKGLSFQSKINFIKSYNRVSGELVLDLDFNLTAQEESDLDALLAAHDHTTQYPHHKILDLVDPRATLEGLHNINYKIELISETKMTPVFHFHINGLIEKTEYFHDYVSPQNPGNKILVVEEEYELDGDQEDLGWYPSQIQPISREKTWKWVLSDGTLDEIDIKVKTKLYDTITKKVNEGTRRRNNLVSMFSEGMATGSVLSGAFTDVGEAYMKMGELLEHHATAYESYINTGRGTLYDDLMNATMESPCWMDTVVPDTPYTQALCPTMIGLTLRVWGVEKLKGLI